MVDISILKQKPKPKCWKHDSNNIIFNKLEKVNINGKRYYITPEQNYYPSVTTFLKYFGEPDYLKDWRKRIGEENAEKESNRTCERGELIHYVLEKMLNNEDYNIDDCSPYQSLFKQIQKVLIKNLTSVCYTEQTLYSDKLKLAGTADLIGYWNNQLSIIDFKNKNWNIREVPEDYLLQCCSYAIMYFERTGILPIQLIIVASSEKIERLNAQVFIEYTKSYIPELIKKINIFHKESDYYKCVKENLDLLED